MTSPRNISPGQRWLWGTCIAAFVIGLGLGWRNISGAAMTPMGVSVIEPGHFDQVALTHPLSPPRSAAEVPGSLRIWLHAHINFDDAPVAEVVEPVAFNLGTPWLAPLLDERIRNLGHTFSLRMRGQICFSAPLTNMHLKCDNGYRITLRNAQGTEVYMDNWVNDVTPDFYFRVTAEPGCYEIEIDYSNVQGDGFFDLWSEAKDISFFPSDSALGEPTLRPMKAPE